MVSQIKVNEIIKQSGSSITIGESGDTVSIPSGASFSAAGLGKIGQIVDSGTSPNQAEIGSSSFTALTDGSTPLAATITPKCNIFKCSYDGFNTIKNFKCKRLWSSI